MWSKVDELRFSVLMGLQRGLSFVRGMRWALTEDGQHKLAGVIVEHLDNWKIEQGSARTGHGPNLMSK